MLQSLMKPNCTFTPENLFFLQMLSVLKLIYFSSSVDMTTSLSSICYLSFPSFIIFFPSKGVRQTSALLSLLFV